MKYPCRGCDVIVVYCPTCPKFLTFKNQAEARRRGWRGMGWKRPFVRARSLSETPNYWGQCPWCKAAEEAVK